MQVWMRKAVVACVSIGLAAGSLALTSGCSSNNDSAKSQSLSAGGATFINPMMAKWAHEYFKEKAIRVGYNPTGSGAGIAQMIEKTIDFGCSDAPMNEEQLKKAKDTRGEVVHIPLAMGAVVPAYNLVELEDKPVLFTGEVLAEIYLGKIKKWDDARLQALQEPGVTLPAKDIVVVHRSDGSGTTYIWADYLSKMSKEWKKEPGKGTTLKWPAGVGQKGNDGVTDHVKQTPGAIGYIELIYAIQNGVKYGRVKNQDGNFVLADLKSVTAAAAASLKEIPDNLCYSLTDAPGNDSYPIAGTNWAILYVDPPSGKGKGIYDYLWWVTHDGQNLCEPLHYARLPSELVTRIEKQLARVKK
jgi:phosphate ABC transporter phosphate-binding protein